MPSKIAIDVTNLTLAQRKQVFNNYFDQAGFKQFIKKVVNQKILYQFSYT